MRTALIPTIACLVGLWHAPALSAPPRIASLNLCTDQLLLSLADRQQVASITFLARHAQSSHLADAAAGHHLNHGQAEELIEVAPDIVVVTSPLAPAKRRFLNDLGYRVELFELADSIADVYANIARMAALLEKRDRGAELIREMRLRLESVLPDRLPKRMPRGAIYEPNGYTGGRDTLRGDLLNHSLWHNVASDAGISDVGILDLETLMLLAPDRLILSPYAPGTQSLGQRLRRHPAVLAITSQRPPLTIPIKYWICGGVMNSEAVARLVKAHAQ